MLSVFKQLLKHRDYGAGLICKYKKCFPQNGKEGVTILNYEFVISSCDGVIEEITVSRHSRIYEWEKLFTIRTDSGQLETVSTGISGEIYSLEVQVGDRVIPGMVLAFIKEDLVASGSD